MKKWFVFLSLAMSLSASAQTIFYLDRLTTAPISPTVNAAWGITTANTYVMMYPGKTLYARSVANATITSDQIGAAAVKKGLIQTYISQPLIAQTLSSGGTISMQIKGNMSSTSSRTGQLYMYARLCNEDGSNVREIGNAGSTNLSTTATNRTITITLGSNVTVNDNDRLIVEVGWNYLTGSVTSTTASILVVIGVTSSDLPVDNTTTTTLNPHIDFSQTILFRKQGITL